MNPQIRPLQEADVDDVFSLLRELYHQPVYPLGGCWTKPVLEQELKNQWGLGFWEGSNLKSFVLYRDLEDIWDVVLLGTGRASQGCGRMTHLMAFFIKSCPPEKNIWLEVHERNQPAQKLYKKLGFRQVGRRLGYYRDGGSALLFSLR